MRASRRSLVAGLFAHSSRRWLHRPPNFPKDAPRRIIFGSCSDSTEDLTYWDTIHSLRPDLVILMGDNVYGRRSTLRDQYKLLTAHPSFERAKKDVCILATMDDNDFLCSGDATSKEDALDMFVETFQPNLVEDDVCKGIYQSYDWASQLQILLLDTRSFASPLLPTDEPGAPGKQCHLPDFDDRSKTWLGERQWEWLEDALDKDFSRRIIVSPIQVLSTGHGFECWYMLPYERERLLKLIEQKNSLILSGDRHASALYRDGCQHEITASSLTHTVPRGLLDSEQDPCRLSDFCYENNFGMLELESDHVRATIRSAKTGVVLQDWRLS